MSNVLSGLGMSSGIAPRFGEEVWEGKGHFKMCNYSWLFFFFFFLCLRGPEKQVQPVSNPKRYVILYVPAQAVCNELPRTGYLQEARSEGKPDYPEPAS